MENGNLIRDSVLKNARWSQQMGDNIKVIRKVYTKKDRRKVGKMKKKEDENFQNREIHKTEEARKAVTRTVSHRGEQSPN